MAPSSFSETWSLIVKETTQSVLGMHYGGSELYNRLELDDRKLCDLRWIVAWRLHRIVAYREPMRRHPCYSL